VFVVLVYFFFIYICVHDTMLPVPFVYFQVFRIGCLTSFQLFCFSRNHYVDNVIVKRVVQRRNNAAKVSVHLLEKWYHFVSPKTLLRFRVWVELAEIRILDFVTMVYFKNGA